MQQAEADAASGGPGEDGLGGGGGGSIAFGSGETLSAGSVDASASASKGGSKRPGEKRRNPEVDSFAYIEMLLEALAALGKLGYALDAVGQRVQGEMFALVEGTVEEVEERCVGGYSLALSPSRLAG